MPIVNIILLYTEWRDCVDVDVGVGVVGAQSGHDTTLMKKLFFWHCDHPTNCFSSNKVKINKWGIIPCLNKQDKITTENKNRSTFSCPIKFQAFAKGVKVKCWTIEIFLIDGT
jgi:hypothetical protein